MNVCRRIDLRSVTDLHGSEWLVTNKLGGYASGTVAGPPTRGYHALLIAALPAPIGRMAMLQVLREALVLGDGSEVGLVATAGEGSALSAFHLENGLPVWQYRYGALVLEKRVFMPQAQNTVHVGWRLLEGAKALLRLRSYVKFRPLTRGVDMALEAPYTLVIRHDRYELHGSAELPPLRMCVPHRAAVFIAERASPEPFHFELEKERGYASDGALWCPGTFAIEIAPHTPVTFTASTEPWDTLTAPRGSASRPSSFSRPMRS